VHGIHFHAVGRCDPPDFMSAGDHFNPTNRQHGQRNPQGPHAGDLPNLTVEANGTATYQATNALVTLGPGANSLLDADGSALVIHADPDDDVTDPAGNSGGRIACAVIARS
jgi:Cu-Zn family superoxide dismutase